MDYKATFVEYTVQFDNRVRIRFMITDPDNRVYEKDVTIGLSDISKEKLVEVVKKAISKNLKKESISKKLDKLQGKEYIIPIDG